MSEYIPSFPSEREQMLRACGKSDISELYSDVPSEILLRRPLDLPAGQSELSTRRRVSEIAEKNKVFKTVMRGAGAYRHYIPSIVKSVVSREEFVTAYTPYQPEISQGILQSIFEYQTMICSLTGMDASNASVYDGATAAAEALTMCRDRKRTKALVSEAVNPQVLSVMKTYCFAANAELVTVPVKDGKTDISTLSRLADGETCCFYLQQPNFYGVIEDAAALGEAAHALGLAFIMGTNPMYLAIGKTPAECGADIAVGEAQPLGLGLSFGGPYLGYMAASGKYLRHLPGRIVGQTADAKGNRAYVLTLQAREQHIRREKSSSNICSNQAHCALTAAVYMAAMGKAGMTEAASQCHSKAEYAKSEITKIKGFEAVFSGETFHEFTTNCPICPDKLNETLAAHDILGPYVTEDGKLIWCFTEMNTKDEIDTVVALIKGVLK